MRRAWTIPTLVLAATGLVLLAVLAFVTPRAEDGDPDADPGGQDAAPVSGARLVGAAESARQDAAPGATTSGLSVRVTDGAGRAVPGAQVEALRETVYERPWTEREIREPAPAATARADGEGRAALGPLEAGRWRLRARAGDRISRLARRVELAPGPPVDVHLVLGAAYALEGVVRDEQGAPVEDARVALAPEGGQSLWRLREAGGDGRYRFDRLPPGLYHVGAARPGQMLRRLGLVAIPDVARRDLRLGPAATVAGRVTEASSGRPLPGASVSVGVSTPLGGIHRTVRTDDQGRYRVEGVPPMANTRITARLDGYVPWEEEHDALWFYVPAGTVRTIDMALRRGASLAGSVRDGAGRPVADARVELQGASHWGQRFSREERTDAEGRYRFDVVPAGSGLLRVFAAGYHQPGRPVDVQEARRLGLGRLVELPPTGAVTADVVLVPAGRIEGVILDETGAPAAGAVASLLEQDGPRAAADPDGAFVLASVPVGEALVVEATRAAGGRAVRSSPIRVEAGACVRGVTLRLPRPIRVRGTVRTATGRTPEDVVVRVAMLEERNDLFDDEWTWRADALPVAPDGSFSVPLRGVEPYFSVRAEAPGFAPVSTGPVPVEAPLSVLEVEITLPEPATCRVHVLDRGTGAAVPNAVVHAKGLHDEEVELATDANGELVLPTRPDRPFGLWVQAPGYVGVRTDDIEPGTEDLAVELDPALTVSGRVLDEDGRGVACVGLVLTSSDSHRGRRGRSDGEGSFTIGGLAAGTYRLQVTGDADRPGAGHVVPREVGEVEAGARDLVVRVSRGLRIAGRVVDASGAGVAAVRVGARQAEGPGRSTAWSGPDGTFALEALRPGAYLVTFGSPGEPYLPVSLSGVEAGRDDVVVVLEDGLSITGRVVDPAGGPVSLGGLRWWCQSEEDEHSGCGGRLAPDGSFEIRGLRPGPYHVHVGERDGGPWLPADVPGVAAGTRDLVVVLRSAGAISGRVVDADGAPVFEAQVAFWPEGGEGRPWWSWAEYEAYTDSEGRFRQEGLDPARTWTVILSSYDEPWAWQGVRGVSCGRADLRFVRRGGRTLEGRLVDAEGVAVEDGSVAVLDEAGLPVAHAGLDQDGRFVLRGLPTGIVELVAMDGHAEHPPVAVGRASAGDADVVLRLPR